MGRKSARLYEVNDLVNLRLTGDRSDILKILNAKKMGGEDVSEYLAMAIREKEGIGPAIAVPSSSAAVVPPPPMLDMDHIVQSVISALSQQGLVVAAAGNVEHVEPIEEQEDEAVKEGVMNAVKNLLSFGGDDDDDDD